MCKRDIECSYYSGNDKEQCESIIPKTDTYESKCVFDDGNCRGKKRTLVRILRLGKKKIIVFI